MLLCFLMLVYLGVKYMGRSIYGAFIIPAALLAGYVLTVFVNASRIFAAVIVQKQASRLLTDRPHLILHEIVGVVTNLVFLILIYYLSERFLIHKYPDAKLT
jgi:exosortase K